MMSMDLIARRLGGILLFSISISCLVRAADDSTDVVTSPRAGAFALSANGASAPLVVSSRDFPGVLRAAGDLRGDIERVSALAPEIIKDSIPHAKEFVLVGTLGKSALIDRLVASRKIDVSGIAGQWESYLLQVVRNPFDGVECAFVIVGSDKRGTIFGMYDLSAKIGVSPWYWWADVPPKKKKSIYILAGTRRQDGPKIKYRGIFINDEAPSLAGWAKEKFGGFNSKFYGHVFELILRLKGNFLWPAMWGSAFYDDDPENPRLADEYGVVIGTSHHEPMMRAHDEWRRYGKGPWQYDKNDSTLREFWRTGIKRMGSYESVVTVGMRGDGDMPMSAQANIGLLEKIVADQRAILGDVTGKDVRAIPQVWALYKEVQEYYDKGMRVPDDVTLLLCDDNWGNIRKLPSLDEKPRAGGYGIYYHFDYVGDPRNYKWLNTNQISRTWEQMRLAYEFGARQEWIVNVGDIKPMEYPISFFLDDAWNPERMNARTIPEYATSWAAQQFPDEWSAQIGRILEQYTRFNSRRKPELLSPETYSLVNYGEADAIVGDYNALTAEAEKISRSLPAEYRDAFFELVLHPVSACANLNELYVTVARNRLYAEEGRSATNALAARARELYARDSSISYYYNAILANGKWSHMMDQTHIGYTYWQQPEKNSMPQVSEIDVPVDAHLGVAVDGSTASWPTSTDPPRLPEFDPYGPRTSRLEIFNRGQRPFTFALKPRDPWIRLSRSGGTVDVQETVLVSIDWKKAPKGNQNSQIVVSGPDKSNITVRVDANNRTVPESQAEDCFVESGGCVSMEAEHYTRALGGNQVRWEKIPDIGRTLSGVTLVPVTATEQKPESNAPHLEYRTYLFDAGNLTVTCYLSPTLDFHGRDLRYAVALDDETPQIVSVNVERSPQNWRTCVSNNITTETSTHHLEKAGMHVLKFWMIDPGLVLQKLVVDLGGVKPSYLGPPESARIAHNP